MIKANSSHDLSFKKQDGTEIGLMIAQDKNGIPMYAEVDDESLAQQFFSGAPGYANLPPEKELQVFQDDWRSGMGEYVFDSSDPKRYWKAVNMDLRFKGQAFAGPKATAITKANGVVRASGVFNGVQYIGNGDKVEKLNTSSDAFQEVTNFGGTNITDMAAFGDKFFIALGKDTKYQVMNTGEGFVAGNAADAKADFFQVVDDNFWKACKPNELKSAVNGAPETQGWTGATYVGSTTDNILGMFEESGQLFIRKEDMPYYIDTSGNVHRLIPATKSMQGDTTGDKAGDVWLGKVYFPYGAQGLVEYDPVNEIQTWRSPAKYCTNLIEYVGQVKAVTHDEEWLFILSASGKIGAVSQYQYYNTGDDYTYSIYGTCWVAQTFTPTISHKITNVRLKLYRLGLPGTLTVSIKATDVNGHPTGNDLCSGTTNGDTLPTGSPYEWRIITLGNGCDLTASTKYAIVIRATAGTSQKTVICRVDGTSPSYAGGCLEYSDSSGGAWTSYTAHDLLFEEWGEPAPESQEVDLLAGRLEEIDGVTSWVWHPLGELTLTGCQIIFVSSTHKKRLYIASNTVGDSFYYYPLPTTYGNLDSDTDYEFQTNGYFITPWHHANLKADYKAWIKLTLNMANTDAAKYFRAYYRTMGITDWTEIAPTDKFKASPTTTQYIPLSGAETNPSGTMIQFKFQVVTNDSSTTPKLLDYDCRGIWYPTKRKIIATRIKCADKLTLKDNKSIDSQKASDIKTAIEEARDDATWPITFYDIDGIETKVKVLSAKYVIAEVDKIRNKERVWDLTLLKVALA